MALSQKRENISFIRFIWTKTTGRPPSFGVCPLRHLGPKNTAGQLESNGKAGAIQISEGTKALIEDAFAVEERVWLP